METFASTVPVQVNPLSCSHSLTRSDHQVNNDAAYEGTRIVGPEKPSAPDPDHTLQARLMLLLKDRKKVAHVLQVSFKDTCTYLVFTRKRNWPHLV